MKVAKGAMPTPLADAVMEAQLRRNWEAEATIMGLAFEEARAEVERLSVAVGILKRLANALAAEKAAWGWVFSEDHLTHRAETNAVLAEYASLAAVTEGTETDQ